MAVLTQNHVYKRTQRLYTDTRLALAAGGSRVPETGAGSAALTGAASTSAASTSAASMAGGMAGAGRPATGMPGTGAAGIRTGM